MPHKILDTKGLTCPLPILKAKRAMSDLEPGDTLEVLSTDPGAVEDFESFCKVTRHTLVSSGQSEGVYRFIIKKSGA